MKKVYNEIVMYVHCVRLCVVVKVAIYCFDVLLAKTSDSVVLPMGLTIPFLPFSVGFVTARIHNLHGQSIN